jgi:hypothetical protein
MHLVCLGVVRRLLKTWLTGNINIRISPACSAAISQKLECFREHIPVEFARKPRSLQEIDRWKATEFRLFLIYTGSVALKGNIRADLYENFVCFMVSILILLSPRLCSTWTSYSEQLLVIFVQQCEQLYGPEFIVYNVHSIIHIPDDVRKFGALDKISSFPFESFLGKIKKVVRKPQDILQQLSRRLSEGYFQSKYNNEIKTIAKKMHTFGPLLPAILYYKQYCELNMKEFTLKLKDGDNCIMLKSRKLGKVVNILENEEKIYVLLQQFMTYEPFFLKPLDSTRIGIFLVSVLSEELILCHISLISNKYVLLPYRDRLYVAIPLLHTGAL